MALREIIIQLIIASVLGLILFFVTRRQFLVTVPRLSTFSHAILKYVKYVLLIKVNGDVNGSAYKLHYSHRRNKH